MSGLERCLKRLEDIRPEPADEQEEREAQRERIRETAEHINHCRDRGTAPLFEIAENGEVVCSRDGKPVTDSRQTLAEVFYLQELAWGGSSLVHDEEAQAFYTPEGELAVSRDRFALGHLLNR